MSLPKLRARMLAAVQEAEHAAMAIVLRQRFAWEYLNYCSLSSSSLAWFHILQ
jgi:hypothetical protein